MHTTAIVPAFDEQAAIEACVAALLSGGARVIVVDGGSRDETCVLARAAGAEVVTAARGRASQMNAGAGRAGETDVIVFVHADTRLPEGWREAIAQALAAGGHTWGRFDVRFDSTRALLRVVATMMNLRSRMTGICTGDQAIFVTRAAFEASGGFPAQALMEDVEFSRRMKRIAGAPAALRERVLVSARRWERHGAWRTIALMTLLRSLYALGVSPAQLHRMYYGRSGEPQ